MNTPNVLVARSTSLSARPLAPRLGARLATATLALGCSVMLLAADAGAQVRRGKRGAEPKPATPAAPSILSADQLKAAFGDVSLKRDGGSIALSGTLTAKVCAPPTLEVKFVPDTSTAAETPSSPDAESCGETRTQKGKVWVAIKDNDGSLIDPKRSCSVGQARTDFAAAALEIKIGTIAGLNLEQPYELSLQLGAPIPGATADRGLNAVGSPTALKSPDACPSCNAARLAQAIGKIESDSPLACVLTKRLATEQKKLLGEGTDSLRTKLLGEDSELAKLEKSRDQIVADGSASGDAALRAVERLRSLRGTASQIAGTEDEDYKNLLELTQHGANEQIKKDAKSILADLNERKSKLVASTEEGALAIIEAAVSDTSRPPLERLATIQTVQSKLLAGQGRLIFGQAKVERFNDLVNRTNLALWEVESGLGRMSPMMMNQQSQLTMEVSNLQSQVNFAASTGNYVQASTLALRLAPKMAMLERLNGFTQLAQNVQRAAQRGAGQGGMNAMNQQQLGQMQQMAGVSSGTSWLASGGWDYQSGQAAPQYFNLRGTSLPFLQQPQFAGQQTQFKQPGAMPATMVNGGPVQWQSVATPPFNG